MWLVRAACDGVPPDAMREEGFTASLSVFALSASGFIAIVLAQLGSIWPALYLLGGYDAIILYYTDTEYSVFRAIDAW